MLRIMRFIFCYVLLGRSQGVNGCWNVISSMALLRRCWNETLVDTGFIPGPPWTHFCELSFSAMLYHFPPP